MPKHTDTARQSRYENAARKAGWRCIRGKWEIADPDAPGGRSIMESAEDACHLDGIRIV